MARKGRPPAFNADRARAAIEAVRNGADRETAAAAAGISPRTLYRWVAAGKKARKGEFWQFCQSLEGARGEVAVEMAAVVIAAARKGDWRAAITWLERQFPESWGDSAKLIRELQKRFAEVEKLLAAAGHTSPAPPPAAHATPRAAG